MRTATKACGVEMSCLTGSKTPSKRKEPVRKKNRLAGASTVGVYYYKNYGKEIKPDEYQKINYKTGGDPDEFDLEMADRRESPRN
mmetsp:Transcript_1457/g.1470  ORF Transcript_1457/g.1470 Transcript_1457/m.1470 type:complete len:85 (-) Transcript_1457:247-501(-)